MAFNSKANTPPKTEAQLKEERRQDVMAYAFRDTDGKLYAVDASGDLYEALPTAKTLSPEYQAMANKTAALAIFYRRIDSLNETQKASLMGMLTGKLNGASKEVDASTRKVFDDFKLSLKDFGIKMPGEDTANFLSDVFDGASLPIHLVTETLGSVAGVARRLFTKELTRSEALAIGTAYASARQAAAEKHPKMEGIGDFFSGLFSKHFGTFAAAGFFQLLDAATGMLEAIPGIGDWVKKQGWHDGKSWASRVSERMIDGDNKYAKESLAEFASIGGQDGETVGKLLVDNGTITSQAGEQTEVTKDEKGGPETNKQKKTVDEAIDDRDKNKQSFLGILGDAYKNGVDFTDVKKDIKDTGPVGLGAGAAFTGQMVRGVAEGVVRNPVKRVVATAKKTADEAASLQKTVDALNTAKKTHHKANGWKFWQDAESVTDMEARLAKLKTTAASAKNTADQATALAGSFTKTAMEKVPHGTWAEAVWDFPRKMGRKIGDVTGHTLHGIKKAAVGTYVACKGILPKTKIAGESFVEGVNDYIGAASQISKNPSALSSAWRWMGKAGTKCLRVVEPILSGARTGLDIINNDQVGMAIHGSETVAITTGIAKFGVKRATPYIAPLTSAGELVYSYAKDDKGGMVEHTTELGTMASAAATGARLGGARGALVGLAVGGIVSIFTGWGARAWYESGDELAVEPTAPPSTQPDAGLASAVTDIEKKKQAQKAVQEQRVAFNQNVSTSMGAVNPDFQLLTLGNTSRSQVQGVH